MLLAPKVPGYIVKVNVSDGAKVKQGDVLVQIDQRDFQNSLAQIKNDLVSMEARKKDAERNFHRLQELYSKGAVSQQQFDTVKTTFSEVKAKYDAVAAQVSQAELNLENTQIKAPADGVIAKSSAEVGQLAAPGAALVGFVGSEDRWITANFKETEIKNIKIGAAVEISVDALNTSFQGEVESISAATGATFALLPPDNATGNFTKVVQRVPVKIKFLKLSEQDKELLKAGLSAEVKVRK